MTDLDCNPADASPRPWAAADIEPLGMHAAIWFKAGTRGAVVAFVGGELDLSCAARLTAALRRALHQAPSGLVIDLARVEFCDCAGLRALQEAVGFARARGLGLEVGARSPAVSRVVELTGCQLAGNDPASQRPRVPRRTGAETLPTDCAPRRPARPHRSAEAVEIRS